MRAKQIGVLATIALLMALTGCVSSRPYQTDLGARPTLAERLPAPVAPVVKKECATPTACTVFVEYDDYGNPMNRAQLLGAIEAAKETASADGTVLAWGSNSNGQASPPAGLTGVQAIAASAYTAMALKSDGTIVGWGYTGYGHLRVPAGLTGVQTLVMGDTYAAALKSDGTVAVWGTFEYPMPVGLTGVKAISSGPNHIVALRATVL